MAWALDTVDDRLTLERPGHDSAEVLLLSRDALWVDGFRLTVERDGSRVTGFGVSDGTVTDILFERVDG